MATALVTLVSLAVLGGVVGLAAADGDESLPASLSVASPRTGDHAVYDVQGWGNVTTFSVERGLPEPVRDRHGEMVLAEPWDGWYELGTGRLVAVGFEDWHRNEEVRDSGNPLTTAERWSLEDLRGSYVYPETDWRSCWLHNGLHGAPASLSVPVRVLEGCRVAGTDLAAGSTMRAVAVEEVAGHRAVRFEGAQATAWFAPEVPYPVGLDVHTGNGTASFRLASYEPGDVPAPMDAATGVAPAAALQYRARLPWGFDDSGVGHPWPASEAYAAAHDAVTWSVLRDWSARHPDHYPTHMEFRDRTYNGDRLLTWRFELVSEDSRLSFYAERTVADLGVLDSETVRDEFGGDSRPLQPGTYPHPDDVPDAWPTVASLQARLHDFAHEAVRINVTSWQMDPPCLAPCTQPPTISVEAERYLDDLFVASGVQAQEQDRRHVRFDLRITGEAMVLQEMVDSEKSEPSFVGGDPGGAGLSTADEPEPPQPLASAAAWSAPSPEQAAGAGALALLVGLAYWLWPSLKAAPAFGLFSRLRRPELLGHPVRRRILDAVEAEPGLHFGELLRRTGLSNGGAQHHLRKLTDAGLLRVHQGGGYTCYHPAHVGGLAGAAPALRSETARSLLRAIASEPGRTTGDTARAAGVTGPNAAHHLKRMREAGLVERRRDGRSLLLFPTEDGRRALRVLVR